MSDIVSASVIGGVSHRAHPLFPSGSAYVVILSEIDGTDSDFWEDSHSTQEIYLLEILASVVPMAGGMDVDKIEELEQLWQVIVSVVLLTELVVSV